MFYNFNRHKKQPCHGLNAAKKSKSRIEIDFPDGQKAGPSGWFATGLAASRVKFRHMPLLILLSIGVAYCVSLVLTIDQDETLSRLLKGQDQSQQTIRMAMPGHQPLEAFFDSLHQAEFADSILQSQQTILDHAENSLHP